MSEHDPGADPFVPADLTDPAAIAVLHGIDPDRKLDWPTKPSKTAPHAALVLTLGGAPTAAHRVEDLPGYYRPDSPTPVGGPGEASQTQAETLGEAPGAPVALVYLTDKQLDAARSRHAHDLADARNGLLAARPHATGGEVEQLADEIQAQKETQTS